MQKLMGDEGWGGGGGGALNIVYLIASFSNSLDPVRITKISGFENHNTLIIQILATNKSLI